MGLSLEGDDLSRGDFIIPTQAILKLLVLLELSAFVVVDVIVVVVIVFVVVVVVPAIELSPEEIGVWRAAGWAVTEERHHADCAIRRRNFKALQMRYIAMRL
ncbi:hypothetical protein Fmac_025781 [Flemingia macrophylla]|uniref:Uncharacterized protein n=1 Tax=Flemingia macrophylla TaxID=520843 RepID=A0ABD1LT88_9FABA